MSDTRDMPTSPAPAVALPAPFAWREGQIVLEAPAATVVFSTRAGGDLAGAGPSAALRAVVGPAPEQWAQDHQVHGRTIRTVTSPVTPMGGEFDGEVTAARDVAVVVRAADCLPIALVASEAVGVVHGGWRGLAAGVVEAGVDAMRALGATGIRGVIGPGARVCCYETGDEVHAAFAHLGPGVRRGRHADLPAVAAALLGVAGVTQIDDVGLCTMCAADGLLFSHRRDGGMTGRQGAIAWRS